MFQLYDKTRRRICMAGFVMLGLLPTALVASWCISRHLPGHLQSEAQELSGQLGLEVRLQGLRHPCPGTVIYENLEIVDSETSQILLTCRQLKIESVLPSPNKEHRAALALLASQTEIHVAGIGPLWKLLQRTIEGHHGRLGADLQLIAGDVTLVSAQPSESQTLTDVAASLETEPNRTEATVQFRVAGGVSAEPARIRVVRNREISPPVLQFDLDTGSGELPCSVLAMGMNEWKMFGTRCRFRGRLWASELQDGWEGEIVAGQLVDIDLDRLVSDQLPHRLTGTADLTVQSAKFCQGRLEEASVLFSAGPGTIDRSLIDSAVEHWGLTPTTGLAHAPEQVPYQQIAFLLTIDPKGARVQGCSRLDGVPWTILAGPNGRMLDEPLDQPRPVAALVQTLVPQNELQVPASRQTVWFLDHLPLPQIVRSTTNERATIQAKLHLRQPGAQ